VFLYVPHCTRAGWDRALDVWDATVTRGNHFVSGADRPVMDDRGVTVNRGL
jgi:hypothetical protein